MRIAFPALLPAAIFAATLAATLAGCSPDDPSREERPVPPSPLPVSVETAGAAVPVAAAGVEGAMRAFRAWDVACDNTRTCTLFGFPGAEGAGVAGVDGWGFVRVERPAAGAPLVLIAAGESDGSAPARLMEVSVDGGRMFRVSAGGTEAPYHGGALRGAEAEAFVAAVRGGRAARVLMQGSAPVTISLDGAAAALLWADERQGRVGGRTGAAWAEPVIEAVRPFGGTVAAPADLLRRPEVAACLAEQADGFETGVTGTRLTPTLVLWEVPCGSGAYNFTTAFFSGDAAGGELRPLPFTFAGDAEDRPANHLVNAGLEGGRIESFEKGRGIGDCGVLETWTWDGRAFVKTASSVMGRCEGVVVDDWPVLHRAAVR